MPINDQCWPENPELRNQNFVTFITVEKMRLFHVSENGNISFFQPKASPSFIPNLRGDVVFGISESLLHNYLVPRDCPRVTYYVGPRTTQQDIDHFLGESSADHVMALESRWIETIQKTTLYCYELPASTFTVLDECAGYFVSYDTVYPISVTRIDDAIQALSVRNVELRFMPSLERLANAVKSSTLNFSLIRMRNAKEVQ
jgi:hypothetical protein